jgi:hypothetical protein
LQNISENTSDDEDSITEVSHSRKLFRL